MAFGRSIASGGKIRKVAKHRGKIQQQVGQNIQFSRALEEFSPFLGKPIEVHQCESEPAAYVDFGQIRYPLRAALSPADIQRLSMALMGTESDLNDAMKRKLHFAFQRLYRTPPEDKSERDSALWRLLTELIDFDEYERWYPLPEPVAWEVVSVNEVQVRLLTDDSEEETLDPCDLDSVGNIILSAQPGMRVYGEIRRHPDGRTEWLDCRLSVPLRSDEEVWAQEGSTIRSLDELPEADWPRRKDVSSE